MPAVMARDRDLDSDDPPLQTIGDRIRLARDRAKLTQTELALAVGVDKGTVWRWETGRSKVDAEAIDTIAEATKVSPTWLLRGVTEVPPSTVSESLRRYIDARPSVNGSSSPELERFLATPVGETVTEEERDLLEMYQRGGFSGEPTELSMHYLLLLMRAEKHPT